MICEQERARLVQNLCDAGCSEADIEKFFLTWDSGRHEEALALLSEHREQLLAAFHKSQYCMDCLDYLVYKMKEKN